MDIMVVSHADGGVVSRVRAPAMFSFHHANAYEVDGTSKVVLDFISMPDSSLFTSPSLDTATMVAGPESRDQFSQLYADEYFLSLSRFEFDVATGEFISSKNLHLEDKDGLVYPFEFPIVNPNFRGKKHCFVYGFAGPFAGNSTSYSSTTVIKKNVCDESQPVVAFEHGNNEFLNGDLSFVPRPGATTEDDGVILSMWLGPDSTTFLRIIDAADFSEVAVVRSSEHFSVPLALHGLWVSG